VSDGALCVSDGALRGSDGALRVLDGALRGSGSALRTHVLLIDSPVKEGHLLGESTDLRLGSYVLVGLQLYCLGSNV